ncbi:hypothetical protein HBI56_221690 [Parastagonospora nodorum]|nr:hypothetical protein HBI09_215470 [Parastagonospora nodorum]KAH4216952.1 hypothetical protein HBI06_222540 [Parastagonospora nodorum]KAH4226166.1 hypothetical protein HBI05_224210 [Parastagonospora nodorum]KAH4335509.1 hypothetical protein HBH98_234640 [Parastagonospora nodorum]KAH4358205.1 hypothetical protein HBH97_219170 [Parastagonospora nodorum]
MPYLKHLTRKEVLDEDCKINWRGTIDAGECLPPTEWTGQIHSCSVQWTHKAQDLLQLNCRYDGSDELDIKRLTESLLGPLIHLPEPENGTAKFVTIVAPPHRSTSGWSRFLQHFTTKYTHEHVTVYVGDHERTYHIYFVRNWSSFTVTWITWMTDTNIRYMYAGRELESRSAMSDSCSEYVAMHSHSRWI